MGPDLWLFPFWWLTVQFQARTVPKPWMESWELPLKEHAIPAAGFPMPFWKNGRDPPNGVFEWVIYSCNIRMVIWWLNSWFGVIIGPFSQKQSCSELRQVKFFDTLQAGGIQLLEVGGVFGICNVMPGWAPIISDLWWLFGEEIGETLMVLW